MKGLERLLLDGLEEVGWTGRLAGKGVLDLLQPVGS
jgi:hypothetical protein